MATDDAPNPAVREAFSLLNHEIRLEILLALLEDWEAVYTEPKSYAELMDAVGMRDSGQFNYHLDKLRGVYVREVEDGYVPTASVTALYRTVLAHRPTERREFESSEIESACPRCEATLVLRYERGFATVDCPACEEWDGFTYPFPKNGLEERDADAIARTVARRARRDVGLARAGQCPFCAGATTVALRLAALESDNDGGDGNGNGDAGGAEIADRGRDHWVEITCDDCTFLAGVRPITVLLTDARAAGALADVGFDLERYDWELPAPTVRVESREPTRIALEVDGDEGNGSVTAVVDDAFAVRSVTVDS
ncbi:ArsR family transcriptional regulator [Haloterrigena sp. SYSU A121-1]|uniref:ArsR family transcriptional regulator n=1 Tax=Haloterrigena gelatinilytica TaxID=2741724 RepID=A0A8J8KF68_9EURY|nr:ArsR family transcriptional regulator [Haloterrigena gelatinilytica]NUB90732.1 ArsR family transcriptional regulator [Haloterrigena gelatinilytica]